VSFNATVVAPAATSVASMPLNKNILRIGSPRTWITPALLVASMLKQPKAVTQVTIAGQSLALERIA
jgi:hypothetical protein